jgi:serine/threonine protein kinase
MYEVAAAVMNESSQKRAQSVLHKYHSEGYLLNRKTYICVYDMAVSERMSLQVIAWELFTGRKFYGPAPDLQFTMRVLQGELPLPTEQELPPDIRKRLGNSMLRATFMSMLHRDPQMRPSMRQLLSSLESFFSQTRPS